MKMHSILFYNSHFYIFEIIVIVNNLLNKFLLCLIIIIHLLLPKEKNISKTRLVFNN